MRERKKPLSVENELLNNELCFRLKSFKRRRMYFTQHLHILRMRHPASDGRCIQFSGKHVELLLQQQHKMSAVWVEFNYTSKTISGGFVFHSNEKIYWNAPLVILKSSFCSLKRHWSVQQPLFSVYWPQLAVLWF